MAEASLEAVRRALRSLVPTGASLGAIATQRVLVTLDVVLDAAASVPDKAPSVEERAAAARELLALAASTLPSDQSEGRDHGEAARALLALAPRYAGSSLPDRYRACATHLGIAQPTFFRSRMIRRRSRLLLDALADDICLRELDYHRTPVRLARFSTGISIDWLARFERYYTMWSDLAGLADDITIALRSAREGQSETFDAFAVASLHRYASFLVHLKIFNTDRGGLWVLLDSEREQAVADSVSLAREATPFFPRDNSNLRVILSNVDELTQFAAATTSNPTAQRLMGRWRSWLEVCKCDVTDDRTDEVGADCEVHSLLAACLRFTSTLDEDWDALATWYSRPRPSTTVDRVRLHVERQRRQWEKARKQELDEHA